MFPITSRYYTTPTAEAEMADGKKIRYLRRRFLPRVEDFHVLFEHTVVEGDRLDNIAAQYIGDPEQYWRICDANGAMRPDELTEMIGRRIRITLPEGIPRTPPHA